MTFPYASRPALTRGRRHPETPSPPRDDFQRDRDRIVHCTAFRRLVYKTQVFLNHEGDLFRTRLTHSLEVAQLGRSIGRALGLNEDLIEAIALAHDLGHTPFGHAGQDALHACMVAHDPHGGGFEHNFQSLRVVDRLEERYAAFDGLNLTFETREGILKHCSRRNAEWLLSHDPTGVGRRFVERSQPSLEAQLCNLADEIAYNAHDIDDGVRSGLLSLDQLEDLTLIRRFLQEVRRTHPALTGRRVLFETLRRVLSQQVHDVVDTTREALVRRGVASADQARELPPLVRFGDEMRQLTDEVQRFLRVNLYRHPQVVATTGLARDVLRELFELYVADPRQVQSQRPGGRSLPRTVADYIAGMTDRFALQEHLRLTGRHLEWPARPRATD
ncbi:deoxyguanosinetriphosphate triphosphohydrolase [uncultured Piscinibacter sp.]|uniref:deoxyguanosinetriphosphate triphosphohydrolase n=1 Tax=uncultured Piscinibacter sp. TaxID=1131835 RepID=UPI002618639D|nr:deoxyguanosinetriphosphate triphosphohydrolase [uncultured Piscinibacter sp.]